MLVSSANNLKNKVGETLRISLIEFKNNKGSRVITSNNSIGSHNHDCNMPQNNILYNRAL